MVIALNGKRRDTVCPIEPMRIFASGNERTPVRMNNRLKYGIRMEAADSMGIVYDLVNNAEKQRTFYITMVGYPACCRHNYCI